MKSPKPLIHRLALVESKRIGSGTRVWAFAQIMKNAEVGRDCNICGHSFIESGAIVGDRVTVKNGVALWDGIRLEDDVFVGPNAVFTNDKFPISRNPKWKKMPIQVKRGAMIGANATLIGPVTVGRYAFVGAGAVITESVPDYALCIGVKAKVAGYLCSCRKRLSLKQGRARCACGLKFRRLSSRGAGLIPIP